LESSSVSFFTLFLLSSSVLISDICSKSKSLFRLTLRCSALMGGGRFAVVVVDADAGGCAIPEEDADDVDDGGGGSNPAR